MSSSYLMNLLASAVAVIILMFAIALFSLVSSRPVVPVGSKSMAMPRHSEPERGALLAGEDCGAAYSEYRNPPMGA